MGYPTKIQKIERKKGNQWYVNFPNALAEAMNFTKGEMVEWEVLSISALHMTRPDYRKSQRMRRPIRRPSVQ
jgi:antitoxin component of MazEF toxin-antitoxin module